MHKRTTININQINRNSVKHKLTHNKQNNKQNNVHNTPNKTQASPHQTKQAQQ